MSEEIKKGLLGIVVDETTISHVVPELSAGWVSEPHSSATDKNYFLYYDETGFVWSETPWTFSKLQIAEVFYRTDKFCVREVHGLMPGTVHRDLHYNVGTYKESGGAFDAGTYTLNSTKFTFLLNNIFNVEYTLRPAELEAPRNIGLRMQHDF